MKTIEEIAERINNILYNADCLREYSGFTQDHITQILYEELTVSDVDLEAEAIKLYDKTELISYSLNNDGYPYYNPDTLIEFSVKFARYVQPKTESNGK